MIPVKALNIARHMGIRQTHFKASRGWAMRFMNRNQLPIRRRTTLRQKLPSEYESQVVNFHRFVNGLRREHEYVIDTPRDGYGVSTYMIPVKALNIARHMGIRQTHFKASRGVGYAVYEP
ncbi:hypothetical protein HPB50_011319 [Hyalomma asiaticum]|uniref:Uncharacterized protein n=1 Tax=Hyalomma asiaticum TaxID=266040 RepID=A0ACB7SP99_HYAAI|nr:hypothetical protein HPB50_011319 [Hyalomma asiaticum]